MELIWCACVRLRCCYIRTPRGDTLLHVVSFGKHLKSLVVGVGVCDFIAASSKKHVATCSSVSKTFEIIDSVVDSIDCDVVPSRKHAPSLDCAVSQVAKWAGSTFRMLIAIPHHREHGAMRDHGAVSCTILEYHGRCARLQSRFAQKPCFHARLQCYDSHQP